MLFSSGNDFDEVCRLQIQNGLLEQEIIQLKWLLKCKDDPALCPCGGTKGNYHSHALNCKEICLNGRDYGKYA